MSIPERFYRIAKHKFSEFKERIDRLDEESMDAETSAKLRQNEARSELNDALANPRAFSDGSSSDGTSAVPVSSPPARPRTPQQIAQGTRPSSQYNTPPPSNSQSSQTSGPDPLDFHFRLLGLSPGSDFTSVQTEYNKLAARSDPGRFPAGSEEAQSAEKIRQRLEELYRTLRDALDPTSRRFDLLEFDAPKPPDAPPGEGPKPQDVAEPGSDPKP